MTIPDNMHPRHVPVPDRTPAGLSAATLPTYTSAAHAIAAHEVPGPRWFQPGDPIYRLMTDATTPVGELAGIVLESLQPAAAGVRQALHPGATVWDALRDVHTRNRLLVLGTVDDAAVTIRDGYDQHAAVHARDEHGAYFWGGDREVITWTQQAQLWALLAANRTYSPEPLSAAETDTAVAQWARVMHLAGVPDPATTHQDLNSYLRRAAATLRRGALSGAFLAQLHDDAHTAEAAVGLLPTAARRLCGLGWARTSTLRKLRAGIARPSAALALADSVPAPIAPPSALSLAYSFR